MKWTPGGESPDIEDRRDDTGGGGGGGFQFGGMHIGIGGAIILLILSFVFKTNFFALLVGGGGPVSPAPSTVSDPNTPAGHFARATKRKSRWCSLFLLCWMTLRKPGQSILRNKPTNIIATPNWCCIAMPFSPGVAARSPPLGLFIVRRMKRCTSIWASTMN